jgi:hypothetical protein
MTKKYKNAYIKRILVSLVLVIAQQVLYAQDTDKTVFITVSGSGKTQDEAKQSALRSAIEQAFGAFISKKTEVLNDQVIADQMVSVAKGNIQSFSSLNEMQMPNGIWVVTLKAVVSLDKLANFVEANGISVDIRGDMISSNMKQKLLNEKSELKVVEEMVGFLHEPMQVAFDYDIKKGEPKSLDEHYKNWEIPLQVTVTANSNIDFCATYCIRTLTNLSLSSEEIKSYKNLNIAIFPIVINYKGVVNRFYLRNEMSLNILHSFIKRWRSYVSLFTVQSGIDEFYIKKGQYYGQEYGFNFLSSEQKAATFIWDDRRTLSQIEKIKDYKVKPRGVVSQFKHGGIVIYEKDGHGLVAAITEFPDMNYLDAKNTCDELVLNGYSDWRLPKTGRKELTQLKNYNIEVGFLAFGDWYWSYAVKGLESSWVTSFGISTRIYYGQDSDGFLALKLKQENKYRVLAVRSF